MNDLQFQRICLLILAAMVLIFGAYCVSQGHNSTIILSVFALIGAIGGYIFGKKNGSKSA